MGSYTRDPEGYVQEGSGDGHLSTQGPHWGIWKGAHLPWTFERWMKGALEMERLFLRGTWREGSSIG